MTRHAEPGYLRGCMLPGCAAEFNVMTGEGLRDVPGWRQLTRVVPGYLCPAHAPVAVSGAHVPHWLNQDAGQPGMCGIGCACGWNWVPAVPSSAGAHGNRWIAHLAEETAATAAATA